MTARQAAAVTLPGKENLSSLSAHSMRDITGILTVVALLAAVTSLLYFWRFQDFYFPDSPSYTVSASNMASGHGFRDADGYPETFRTPGYPLLIVPFVRLGLDLKYLIVLQHLFRLLVALGACVLAFKFSYSRRQALIAGVLVSLDLPTLEAANTVMSEMFFTVVLLLGFWLLWKSQENAQAYWKTSALAGFVVGASVLIRPVAMFFFAPGALYFLLVSKKLRSAALWSFVVGFSCLPLLWAARNYRQTHKFTVSTVSGVDILLWRAAWVLAARDPGDFMSNLEKRQHELEAQVCDEIKGQRGSDCSGWSPTEKSDYYLRVGTRIVLEHKSDYLLLSLLGAGRTVLGGDAARLTRILGGHSKVAAGILLAFTVPCLCLALVGFRNAWRSNRVFFYLALLFVLYFLGVTAGPEGYSRYRVPIMPIYAVLVASGVDFILERFPRRRVPSSEALAGQ